MDVSPDLISAVTDAVLEEIATSQSRPLEPVYPLVFFDALRVKTRDEGMVRNKAVHVALGVRADGTKEILDLWLEQNEGAKFWLRGMNELRNRGVEDILIAVVDGLKGFREAILAAFPQATVQTCIVHLLRHSLEFVSYKDRKAVATALTDIYRAGRCRRRRGGAGGLRGGALGPQIPRDRPELAPRPGRGHSILRLSRRGPAYSLYHQCHRGPERQAPPGRARQGPLPDRRGGAEAAVPGLEPDRQGVDHARPRVVHGQGPVRRPLRRAVHQGLGLIVCNRPLAHEIPDSPTALHPEACETLAVERATIASAGPALPPPALPRLRTFPPAYISCPSLASFTETS